ncbi:cytochrome C oxidase subunit IV family protein [Marinobacterium aestuariivivens]|uniref:Cytochrome C oxidase subunit IV family protein n=1 Tax=Marinobacterium aestuariivivens TaxID=1698799 RepID=A0ABW1ZZX4_9GAMM
MSDLNSWRLLILLTLSSALIAESSDPHSGLVLLVCGTVIIKGQLVIDNLMALRQSHRGIRAPMLAYFYVLLPLIALALLFPQELARLTTL